MVGLYHLQFEHSEPRITTDSIMSFFSRILLVTTFLCCAQFSFANDWQLSIASGVGSANDPSSANGTDLSLDVESLIYLVANKYQYANNDGAKLYTEYVLASHSLATEVVNGSSGYATSIDSTHLQMGGIYEWANESRFHPYFAMTLGLSHYSPKLADAETYFSGTVALGARLWITRALALRIEARNLGTLLDASSNIFCDNEDSCAFGIDGSVWMQQHYTAGVSWRF